MAQITLSVNGQDHRLDVAGDMPLLWALRDRIGLTGTKYGCGIGQCRACTVQVDGAATLSCQVTAASVQGRRIVTIEGLADGNGLHAVQRAWMAEDVPQCGYCQSGQLMAAAALIAQNQHPSDDEIDAAMMGNLCRCGTYNRLRRAVHRAAREVAE
jgi:isoquinoline 1-oxidoreductase alpha subunit